MWNDIKIGPSLTSYYDKEEFYNKYGRFMIGKLVSEYKKKFEEFMPDKRISPLPINNEVYYYFLDKEKIAYVVWVILWDTWEPADYKAGKIV